MEQTTPRSHADLKYHNLLLVYNTIKNHGPISRTAIAKKTGLSPTSMTRIIGDLAGCGLVEEDPLGVVSGIGRPSRLISLKEDAAFCLCLDLSPGTSRAALMDLGHSIKASCNINTPQGSTLAGIAGKLEGALDALCREAGTCRGRVAYCGVSVPGHVSCDGKIITASAQLDYTNVNAAETFEEALKIPTFVENDCKAALVGEVMLLPLGARRMANIVYMKLGTAGVGGAAVVDGSLLRGSRNAAGEIGHFLSWPECGGQGSAGRRIESIMSESALIAEAQQINGAYSSIRAISQGINAKDEALSKLIDGICEYIAIAINDLSCAYNPDTVVLNGSFVTCGEDLLERVRKYLGGKLLSSMHPSLAVTVAKKGADAELFGTGRIAARLTVNRLIRRMNARQE